MIEQKVYKALTASSVLTSKTSSRIYPVILPENGSYPAVLYDRIAGERIHSLSGYSGVERPVIQVDAFATSYEDMISLSTAVVTVMTGTTELTVCNMLNTPLDFFEDEIEVYHRVMEFSVWSNET